MTRNYTKNAVVALKLTTFYKHCFPSSKPKSLWLLCSLLQGSDAFSQSGLYSNHQDIGPRYAVSNTNLLSYLSSKRGKNPERIRCPQKSKLFKAIFCPRHLLKMLFPKIISKLTLIKISPKLSQTFQYHIASYTDVEYITRMTILLWVVYYTVPE